MRLVEAVFWVRERYRIMPSVLSVAVDLPLGQWAAAYGFQLYDLPKAVFEERPPFVSLKSELAGDYAGRGIEAVICQVRKYDFWTSKNQNRESGNDEESSRGLDPDRDVEGAYRLYRDNISLRVMWTAAVASEKEEATGRADLLVVVLER